MKKRKHICLVLLLCSLLLSLAGCGGKEEPKESGNMGEDPLETKELVISAGTSRSDFYSEAEYYFNGSKSVKEVAKVIKSKVGLYLAERR